MKRAAIKLLTLTYFALCCIPMVALAVESASQEISYLARYMKLYGSTLSNEIIRQRRVQFTPQEIDCGQVKIRFNEALYDGQWLYTSASVWPKDASETLVMPGDSVLDDPVAGFYGETTRKELRSFGLAAIEDNKQLLAIYVYINEFDNLGTYFIDHFQETDNVSVLMSGAQLAGRDKPVDVSWTIQIYEVDLATGKYNKQSEKLIPMTVQPLQPYTEKCYRAIDADGLPFDYVVLAQSPLNTYVLPEWKNTTDKNIFSIALIDDNGHDLPQGVQPAMDAYMLDTLPEKITLSLLKRETGESISQVVLISDDIKNQ